MTTGVIVSPPILQFTLNNGQLAVNGSILTQVGGVNTAVYSDVGLTVPLPNPIPLNSRGEISDATGNSKQLFQTPNQTYTWTLFDGPNGTGNAIWQATYVNGVQTSLTQNIIGALLWPQTAAELAAGVTPTSYAYAPLDVRRYGGDPTGAADSTTAFTSLFEVMLQLGGAGVTIWPGTYKITSTITVNLSPASGPTAVTYGLHLFAEGVVFNYTGTGYAFDFVSPNTAATYGFPLLEIYGANLLGTALATGGFRTRSVSAARWHQVKVQGFTTGPAWTMLNDTSWSENCHFRGCGAVNCQSIIAFQRTGGTSSFARTYVDGMFGAGISNYWFDLGGTIPGVGVSGSCAVYDSRFTHVSGNFTSLALFGIGNSSNASDMTASVVDGTDFEINGLPPSTWSTSLLAGATSATLATAWPYPTGTYTVVFSDTENRQASYINGSTAVTWSVGLSNNVTTAALLQQAIVQLRDYPQNSGVARRPILINIGAYSLFNGVSNNPVWISNTGAALPTGPESIQTQNLSTGPIFSEWGQTQIFEPNFGVAATINAATYDSVLQSGISLTGFASAPTGRCIFSRSGNLAQMKVFDALTGTSNANTMTLTTIPAEYRPATQCTVPFYVVDNGSNITPCYATIAVTGVVSFAINTAFNVNSLTGFTTSGTKGLPSGLVLTWPLT